MIWYDTETCGLHGMPVLIQWQRDDEPIKLHSIWTRPIHETLDLIQMMMANSVVGFNMAFDHFHLCKIYNTLALYHDYSVYPADIIDDLAMLEPRAMDGRCLKPVHCFDLMLHARKGPYQSTMDREDVKIKRVPTALAYSLAEKLNELIPLNPIYFARSKSGRQWHVLDIDKEDGEVDTTFKNVVLKFAPSSALKALVVDIGLVSKTDVRVFTDVSVPDHYNPVEYGYAPFALAGVLDAKGRLLATGPGKWRDTWPSKIKYHIEHWGYNDLAREYAKNDVVYTRKLWEHFGRPEVDDDDSVLACMVGAVRWKGFTLDIEGIKKLKTEAQIEADRVPFIWAPEKVLYYIKEKMDDIESAFITSTGKIILEEIANWKSGEASHPAAIRAQEVLKARSADKEVELYDKLIHAGRFNPSFKVIGTLSTRMSGADGLNPQGINHDEHVRSKFPLSPGGDYQLDGGDFDGFEVVLADAEYNDPNLHKDLLSGKKIHALFGQYVFTDMTYDQIMANKDVYTKCKQAVFAMLYGGEGETLKTRLGVELEVANEAYRRFTTVYTQVGVARKKVFNSICGMSQSGGIGTKVEWREPVDYVESLFGFRRYFTLENRIAKTLFTLAQDPPKDWKSLKIKVTRRDREQSVCGSTMSALYGAAFSIQAAAMRAACNHRIQSSGAQITKRLQRRVWDIQPCGIGDWLVEPLNIHDEVNSVDHISVAGRVESVVNETVESFRETVPLIKMVWKKGLKTWAEK